MNLLYGSESWTIKARDARRITAAEMKYMRRIAGYTWTDHKTNTTNYKGIKKLHQFWINYKNTRETGYIM